MRTIFTVIMTLCLFGGGYYYFVASPTQTTKAPIDHSSLLGKEIPVIGFSTDHKDDPTKNLYVVATVPKISLIGSPEITQNINKTLQVRADTLTQDFLSRYKSSMATSTATSSFNNFALNFTTATNTEKFVAWNIFMSEQFGIMNVATASQSFIAFRLSDGALIDQTQMNTQN